MKQVSRRHNVKGWVRNLKNGNVEAILEGEEMSVNEVIEWCHVGPSGALVDDVQVEFEDYKGEFNSFDILY
jgi:acylphosphatase